jgi:hypothetical protein
MKFLLIVVLALVMLALGFGIGFVAGAASSGKIAEALETVSKPPEGITVTVNAPPAVKVGQPFDLVITITNALDKQRTLGDVDLETGLVTGMTIDKVTPAPQNTSTMVGYHVHTMNATVPAKGQSTVTFTITPKTAGTYTGTVDVYVDTNFSFITMGATIVVEE